MIKLVAIDLDGTLLRDNKTISKRNKKVLAEAKQRGVKIVICTGRPLSAIEHILWDLHLFDNEDYSITFNGGLVQRNQSGEILGKISFSFAEVNRLVEIVQNHNLPIDILSDDTVLQLSSEEKSWYEQANPYLTFLKVTTEELKEYSIFNKAVSAFIPERIDCELNNLKKELGLDFELVKSRDMLLEFLPKGVSKAYGLKILTKKLKLTFAEVMAIGDEENDLSMIKVAGLGVAMANAVQKIKNLADVVTASNVEDGVAQVIEEYVL